MLKKRITTAAILLIALTAVLSWGSLLVVTMTAGLFFVAATWEALRLFKFSWAVPLTAVWAVFFMLVQVQQAYLNVRLLMFLCVLIWVIRLAPSLRIGLPKLGGMGNKLLYGIYAVAIYGLFVSILVFYTHSPLYLISVMAIVWIADIGAYFSGKTFGRRKLAPNISPGKSWEGVIGGWTAVLIFAGVTTMIPSLRDTFLGRLYEERGIWLLLMALTIIVAASVVGDLFESQLKRRAGVKDSSGLLPGHGGVLDRIDALIPVLPLALLIDAWR